MSRWSKTFYTLLAGLGIVLGATCAFGAIVVNPWCWVLAAIYFIFSTIIIYKLYEDNKSK